MSSHATGTVQKVTPAVQNPTGTTNTISNFNAPINSCFGGYMNNNGNLFGDSIFYANDDMMTNSAFGGGFGMNPAFSGMGYGMGYGMSYGMPPMNQGEKPEEYAKRVKDYVGLQGEIQNDMQKSQLNNQVEYQKRIDGVNFVLTSGEDMITRQIGILQAAIKGNKQDKIMSSYNKVLLLVREQLKHQGINSDNVSVDQIKAYAERLYFQATGKSMLQDLEENGDGPFANGLKKGLFGLGWLFCNKRDVNQNIADISGEEPNKNDKVWKGLGAFITGITTGSITLIGVFKIPRLLLSLVKR